MRSYFKIQKLAVVKRNIFYSNMINSHWAEIIFSIQLSSFDIMQNTADVLNCAALTKNIHYEKESNVKRIE